LGAGENITSFKGIKSASQLLLLPKFDIIEGFVFDFMHASFLGVARVFLNIWIDPKYHTREFYVGRRAKEINQKLLLYSVPMKFSRTVRSLDEVKFWKASEWNTWSLISLIVMDGVLPGEYVNHFQLFVTGILLLSGEFVKEDDILKADMLLASFVNDVSVLYGLEFSSFNCHSLLHAASTVKAWGPLYHYSAFQFENYNGMLLNLLSGTKHIGRVISNKMNEHFALTKFASESPRTAATDFFISLGNRTKLRTNVVVVDGILMIGVAKTRFANSAEQVALRREGLSTVSFRCFKSCYVNGNFYTTQAQRSQKQCDSVAEVNGDFFLIKEIILAKGVPLSLVSKLAVSNFNNSKFIYKVTRVSKEIVPLKLNTFVSKFIVKKSSCGVIEKIVKLPNNSMVVD